MKSLSQLPGCFAMTMLDKVDRGDLSKAEAAWITGTLLYVNHRVVSRIR